MKGFKMPRKPRADFAEKLMAENQELGTVLAENLQGALPAIALDGHPALSTAYMNDCEPLLCFAQQVNGYGKAGDGIVNGTVVYRFIIRSFSRFCSRYLK